MAFAKGNIPWNLGKSPSPETRAKQSASKIAAGIIPPSRKGTTISDEHKRLISEKESGENHWNWQGGKSSINERIRKSQAAKAWRLIVFERDNYTCVLCKKVGGELNADHIQPFALFPDLRFEPDNGRTLCVSCHRATDTYGRRAVFRELKAVC